MTPKLTNASFVHAVLAGDKEKVESILKSKRQDEASVHGALMLAIKHSHEQIIHLLLQHTTICIQEQLQIAIVSNPKGIDVIERLLKQGAQVDQQNDFGDTLIHDAFAKGSAGDVIDLLLKSYIQKSTLNLTNEKGIGLLHIACTRPSLNVVKKFVKANSQDAINESDDISLYTPLHYAVKYGRHEIARFLIESGANINKLDRNASTPLHWALWSRDVAMIDLIMSLDERRENLVNKYGLSHFMAACAGGSEDKVEEYLRGFLSEPTVHRRGLIASKVPNFVPFAFKGYTPLHFAVNFNNIRAVEFLLDNGADCCNVADKALTPHVLAKLKGYERIQGLLQEHCDIVKKCREMRAQNPDFNNWGDQYEELAMMESVRTFKHLRGTYDNLRAIHLNPETCEAFQSIESEFISTDFQNDLDLFCIL